MDFVKMHGLGNDFVIMDLLREEMGDKPGDRSLPDFARWICDRHFGVGADGLVLLLPSGLADVRMRIFNPDGSEAQMCGNAIRCVAKYVYMCNILPGATSIRVETLAGIIVPEVIVQDGVVQGVRVDMGRPRLAPREIPVIAPGERVVGMEAGFGGRNFAITCVSMGNPHCVIFGDDPDSIDVASLGPVIENDPMFPEKTNVEFAQALHDGRIKMRVWERGAGLTLACGTGACATVVAGALMGIAPRETDVDLPGGRLHINWAGDDHVYMTGPAEFVFKGEIPW